MSPRACTLALLLCWTLQATPVRVVDGDTFDADVRVFVGQTNRERVRVLGVNAPERTGPTRVQGEAARLFATAWLEGQTLRLQVCERDAFGRLLAEVTRPDGKDLATDLLARGHAVPYPR